MTEKKGEFIEILRIPFLYLKSRYDTIDTEIGKGRDTQCR